MTNFQVWLRGKMIGTFNCPYETALFATNTDVKIDFPPRTEILLTAKRWQKLGHILNLRRICE